MTTMKGVITKEKPAVGFDDWDYLPLTKSTGWIIKAKRMGKGYEKKTQPRKRKRWSK